MDKTFRSGLKINADGSPKAYHPQNIGVDYLSNAGKPGNWWGIACDSFGFPYIQSQSDPCPGYFVSTTSLVDSSKKLSDPSRYLDSEKVPFIVVPNGYTNLGNFAMLLNTKNGHTCGAIVGDVGPKLGEGSIYLAEQLGINSSPKNGGVDDGILTVIFEATSQGFITDCDRIQAWSHKYFKEWGGVGKFSILFPDLFKPKPINKPATNMDTKKIFLVRAAKYYQGMPHQVAALEWLDSQISPTVMTEFQSKFSPSKIVGKAATESTPKPWDGRPDWGKPSSPVSKYFSVAEVTNNDPVNRRVVPGSAVEKNALALANELDKIREAWGTPIYVTSWYRPPRINADVGGAKYSQHIYGRAADIYVRDRMAEFQAWLDDNWYGALGYGLKRGFVHLDMRNSKGWKSGGSKGVRWDY